MPRERGQKLIANNRRARYDYFIDDVFEAGLVLSGTEVKALRQGKASIADAYALVEGGEVWLENAYIPEFTQGSWTNHSTRRKRKLLLAPLRSLLYWAHSHLSRRSLEPLQKSRTTRLGVHHTFL